MNDNETYSDFLKAAKEAFARIAEDLKKAKEAFAATQEAFEEMAKMAEEYKYIVERDPLPQPQKYIFMKCFVIDRRKQINRIKKKKGTVFRIPLMNVLTINERGLNNGKVA